MTIFYDILVLNSVYIRYNTWRINVMSEENNDTTRTVYSCNRQHKEDHCTITVGDCVQYLLLASARGFNSSCVKRERGGELMYNHVYVDAFIHVRGSLASQPYFSSCACALGRGASFPPPPSLMRMRRGKIRLACETMSEADIILHVCVMLNRYTPATTA